MRLQRPLAMGGTSGQENRQARQQASSDPPPLERLQLVKTVTATKPTGGRQRGRLGTCRMLCCEPLPPHRRCERRFSLPLAGHRTAAVSIGRSPATPPDLSHSSCHWLVASVSIARARLRMVVAHDRWDVVGPCPSVVSGTACDAPLCFFSPVLPPFREHDGFLGGRPACRGRREGAAD